MLVDAELQLHLIEGNPRPGLDLETPWQEQYMADMLQEMLELVAAVQSGGQGPRRSPLA